MQGSEFGLPAMAEVVVERPETIFIGTANQVAKGVEHVWRYKLIPVGAERMYVCMEPQGGLKPSALKGGLKRV